MLKLICAATLMTALTGSLFTRPVQAEIFGDLFLGGETRTTTNSRTIIITGDDRVPTLIYEKSDRYRPPVWGGSIGWRDRDRHDRNRHDRHDRNRHDRHDRHDWNRRDRWNKDHDWDRNWDRNWDHNRHRLDRRPDLTFPRTIYIHPGNIQKPIYHNPPTLYRQFRTCTNHIDGTRTCN